MDSSHVITLRKRGRATPSAILWRGIAAYVLPVIHSAPLSGAISCAVIVSEPTMLAMASMILFIRLVVLIFV